MYTTKDIAIIVLNWNGKKLLQQFLPSVQAYSHGASLYVVDNASTDDSIEFIESNYPDISIIKHQNNYGYAKGYNEALTHIRQPIVCLLNSDVEVTSNWLTPIIEVYNKYPEIAIIQPKLLDFKRKDFFEYAGAAGGFIDKYGYPYCRGRVFNTIEKDQGQYNGTTEIFWASGACFFIKKTVFESLNGFDEDYFAHMEEIDLCWRAFNSNYKCLYVGDSEVYHVGGATLANSNAKKTYLNFRNSLITLYKNVDQNLFSLIITRLLLDGIAGCKFVISLKPKHFLAIIRAHFSFYKHLFYKNLKRQKLTPKRKYYNTKSIVWDYYIKQLKYFRS